MTVMELMEEDILDGADTITDAYGIPLSEVCFEPDEEVPTKTNVWLNFEE